MNIELRRTTFTKTSTEGELYIDGAFECFTLEPPVKASGKPRAIPVGSYPVTLGISPRFGRVMPHVNDVPDFEGVLFHYGSFPKDTLACILVGDRKGIDMIWESRREFFDRLMPKLKGINETGATLAIVGTPEAPQIAQATNSTIPDAPKQKAAKKTKGDTSNAV